MTTTPPPAGRAPKDPREHELSVEFGILVFYGMRGFAEDLRRDARAVSARMMGAAKASVRSRHGGASGFAGPVPMILFLSVLICGTTVVATNGLAVRADAAHGRFGADPGVLSSIAAALASQPSSRWRSWWAGGRSTGRSSSYPCAPVSSTCSDSVRP